MLALRAEQSPDAAGQWSLDEQGRWTACTWRQMQQRVAALAHGLRTLGLQPTHQIGVMAASSATWDDVGLAVMAARGVLVGIDAHATPAQIRATTASVQLRGLIVDTASLLERFDAAWLSGLSFVVVLSAVGEDLRSHAKVKLIALRELVEQGGLAIEAPWDESRPDDVATVIFTSGTTGDPKGLAYDHAQMLLAVDAILEAFAEISPGSRLACWLPLSNPFQRMINLCAVARGAEIFYVGNPVRIMQYLPSIRPHVFIGVPRFFEKFHAGLMTQLRTAGVVTRALAMWGIRIGERRAGRMRGGAGSGWLLDLQYRIADALVLRRIRAAFGGELMCLVSGSAPMPLWLLERLHGIGLLVLEAYGLSECIVPVSCNRLGAFRFGSVGRVMKGVQVHLAPDGELLLASEGVSKAEADTAGSTLQGDPDRWLHSGDFATMDDAGFVFLAGRKSEIFKTSTGRRVAPSFVEAHLRSVLGVEHAAVHGAGQKFLTAVVSIAEDAPDPSGQWREAVRVAIEPLPEYLRPAGLVFTRRPFSIEAGELTGNLKLRREQVLQRYRAPLDSLAQALEQHGSMGRLNDKQVVAVDFEAGQVWLLSL